MPIGAFNLNGLGRYQVPAVTGRTAVTITANGNAQLDTAQSKFNGSSALFDGTGDWLDIGDITTVHPNTNDFTLEFWVRFSSLPTAGTFKMLWGTTNANQYFGLWNSSGTYRIAIAVSGTDGNYYADWSNGTTSANTWYHYAFQKSSTTISVYKDGTALTSPTTTGTMTSLKGISGTTTYIGRWSNATSYQHSGWLDEIRLSKNVRYSSTFTPSTTPFVNDTNTIILIHSDGKDAGTSFFDDNGVDRSRRDFIANFNAQISTAQSVFGGASALFDGSGDYISNLLIPAFGTSDFTVECRIRFSAATATGVIFDARGTSGNSSGFCVYVNSSAIRLYHTASDRIVSSTISLNTWYHLAITRSGNDHKMWLNGTQTGSTWTNSASWTIGSATLGFWIGDNQPFPNVGQGFNGYMDEMRISNTARYTGTFTPSSTAFTNDANTVCLLHMNGSNGSTVFNDDNASY